MESPQRRSPPHGANLQCSRIETCSEPRCSQFCRTVHQSEKGVDRKAGGTEASVPLLLCPLRQRKNEQRFRVGGIWVRDPASAGGGHRDVLFAVLALIAQRHG